MAFDVDQLGVVAQELGLRLSPEKPSALDADVHLDGVVEGVRVHVHQWQAQFVHLFFTAQLELPLDLRLDIKPAGIVSKVGELLGKHDIHTGDEAFDAAFDVHGDEPDRVKALLTPAVRASLLGWKKANADFRLTDDGVQLFVLAGVYSTKAADEIIPDIRATAALVRTVSVASEQIPPSALLANQIAEWQTYAARASFEVSASPLRMCGSLDGASFVARAVAVEGGEWGVDLQLRFATPLPWRIHVRPARFFDFMEATGDAKRGKTGNEEFDEELRITTADPERTRVLLNDDTRAALLALHREHGAVVLDSEGLSIRTASMVAPHAFPALFPHVARVAHELRP
jgi:hypothetical protein